MPACPRPELALECPRQKVDGTSSVALDRESLGCHAFSFSGHGLKVASLQSEFCTKDFFRATNFLTKNAPKFSPNFLSLCSVGQKKSPENSLQISH